MTGAIGLLAATFLLLFFFAAVIDAILARLLPARPWVRLIVALPIALLPTTLTMALLTGPAALGLSILSLPFDAVIMAALRWQSERQPRPVQGRDIFG